MKKNEDNEFVQEKKRGGSPGEQKKRKKNLTKVETKDEIKNIKSNTSAKQNIKSNKNINKQIIIIIAFIIICVVLTTLFIILKFKSLDEKYKYTEDVKNVFETESKIDDKDLIYTLKPGDKFDYNDLNINTYYYYNGEILNSIPENSQHNYHEFIQFEGLKNKDIENSINDRIKQRVKELTNISSSCQVQVVGNFSNILSMIIYYYNDKQHYESINIDLNTGNDIKFEDLFAKSAPIYSIIYDNFLRMKAWDIGIYYEDYASGEEYFSAREYALNMNNRDTSNYEDYLYKIVETYNTSKEDFVFTISNSEISIYGFQSNGTYNINNIESTLTIPIYKYQENITAFKKYAGGDLYENNITLDGVRAMYKNMGYLWGNKLSNSIYQETDNMLLDVYVCIASNETEAIIANCKNQIAGILQKYIDLANQDKSNMYVIQCFLWGSYTDSIFIPGTMKYYIAHYSGTLNVSVVKMPMEKAEKLNDYLAITSDLPRASVDPYTLTSYLRMVGNKDIIDVLTDEERMYNLKFDSNGNYLGDNDDVVIDHSKTNEMSGQS